MDQTGGALAIWYLDNSGGAFSARYDRSDGWTDPTMVDSTYPPSDFTAISSDHAVAIASDPQGNAIATWRWGAGSAAIAKYVKGVGWDPAELISVDFDDRVDEVHIGMDSYGNSLTLYSTTHPHGAEHYSLPYSPENGWEPRSGFVSSAILRSGIDLYMNETGYGVAAISRHNSGLFIYRYIPDVGWGLSLQIDMLDDGSWEPREPQIAGDKDGNLFVVWRWLRGDESGFGKIYASRYSEEGGWQEAELLSEDSMSGIWNTPKIGADSYGSAIGVWEEYDGNFSRIRARHFVPETVWNPKISIGNLISGNETKPEIVVDPYGNAVAAWIQETGNGLKIYASRFDAFEGWIGAQSIDVDGDGDSSDLSLAVNDHGQVAVIWAHNDGQTSTIYANRFD